MNWIVCVCVRACVRACVRVCCIAGYLLLKYVFVTKNFLPVITADTVYSHNDTHTTLSPSALETVTIQEINLWNVAENKTQTYHL